MSVSNQTLVDQADQQARQPSLPPDEKQQNQHASTDPPPNGGPIAWLQVFAGFWVFFNPWGMINSFGSFQTYYDTLLPQSASDIAWIGTFQGFLLLFLSALTGPLFDRGHFRALLYGGTFLMVFGMMMTSLSTEYYQIFLSQGLVVGVGSGLLSVPGLAIVSQYFSTRRGLATGIVTAGGSVGALLFPVIFEQLLARNSFAWAARVIGFVVSGTQALSCIFLKPRVPPAAKGRAIIDPDALHSPAFLAVTFAMFFFLMGLYIPVFYISLYAQQELEIDGQLSFYLLSILNAASIFGRAVSGPIADATGPLNLMIPITAITAILQFAWIGVESKAGIIIFAAFYGFFSGSYVTLLGAILASNAPQLNKVGTWIGMNFGISSFGLLIGNPIAGALLSYGDFFRLQIFGGAVVLVGCLAFCFVRYIKFKNGVAWDMKV